MYKILYVLGAVLLVYLGTSVPSVVSESQAPPYRVLVLVPVGSRSLYHLCRSLSAALGDAGHSVTLVSSFPASMKHERVKEVGTGDDNSVIDDANFFDIAKSIMRSYSFGMNATEAIGRKMWSSEAIKKLWKERNTYHAIIIIGYGNEIAVPFLWGYDGAFINICTPGVENSHLTMQGNWLPLSVIPSLFQPFTNHMTFSERAVNLPSEMLIFAINKYIVIPRMQSLLEEFFPGMPPLEDLYFNSSLTLINGHFSLDGPVPLLPTQVEVGTINAKQPQPLPKDLEEFVAGAGEAGVILFSLGSVIKATDIPQERKAALMEAFRRVPQRVVWKYEGDDLDLPPNVITRKWLPQQDILGHNQTRVFMSHCGNLGMQEAQYHGVPVLAVPVAFDQFRNAARMARKGFGVVLNWRDLTSDSLVAAITTLTTDPGYQERLTHVSAAVKDQPETPAQRAVWWVEYTIRHHKSPHIVYAGKRLHLLQYIMLDVLLFWLFILAIPTTLTLFCLRKWLNTHYSKKQKTEIRVKRD